MVEPFKGTLKSRLGRDFKNKKLKTEIEPQEKRMGHRGEILAAMIGVEKQPDMFDTRGTSDMWSIRKSLNGGFLSHGGTPHFSAEFQVAIGSWIPWIVYCNM